MKTMRLVLAAFLVLVLAAPSFAKNDKHDKDNGKSRGGKEYSVKEHEDDDDEGRGHGRGGRKHDEDDDDDHRRLVIVPEYRAVIRDYYHREYGQRGSCPPGLAKKNNGCLPPGQAKKRYQLHQPLPAGVLPLALPPELLRRLGPPPTGYQYGYVDGEILLYETVGRLVVDSIASMF